MKKKKNYKRLRILANATNKYKRVEAQTSKTRQNATIKLAKEKSG